MSVAELEERRADAVRVGDTLDNFVIQWKVLAITATDDVVIITASRPYEDTFIVERRRYSPDTLLTVTA